MSHFSRTKVRHGGSAILIKNNLFSLFKPCLFIKESSIECHSELCGVQVENFCVICCYRPPSGDMELFINSVGAVMDRVFKYSQHVVFCGDLNINYLSNSMSKKNLCDLLNSYSLNVTTTDPTRVCSSLKGITNYSAIDYMATNILPQYFESRIINPHLSDHFAHRLILSICDIETNSSKQTELQVKRNLSPENVNMFSAMIQQQDWDRICMSMRDVDSNWNEFMETIIYCLNCSCPTTCSKQNSGHSKHNWYNEELVNLKNELEKYYVLLRNSNSSIIRDRYIETKKQYKQKIKLSKKTFFQRQLESSDNKPKQIWKIVNNKLNRTKHNNNSIVLRIDDRVVTNPEVIANQFAEYFCQIPCKKLKERYGDEVFYCTVPSSMPHTIVINQVTEQEIIDIISNLKNKGSTGFDEVNTRLLKSIKYRISGPLAFLINESLNTGTFPKILKIAHVTPIFKRGDPENIENYRQVALLSVFSKVLERAVYLRVVDFVMTFNIITEHQHGYLESRSTETASFELLNYSYSQLDQGNYVMILFFDLSIAFDTVNREFLLSKLYNMGIRGVLLEWIESYMSERKIIVKCSGSLSESRPVSLGVPQGSVLGPLLFLLFVNDLPKNISNGHITMFADDTTVAVSARSLEELTTTVNNVTVEMVRYCRSNQLILNANKTVHMNLYIRRPIPSNYFPNITFSKSTKLLGVILDSTLSFEEHIDHVCAKLNSAYFAIVNLRSSLNADSLLTVYFSLAYNHLSSHTLVWGCAADISRVFIGQKRLIRLIFGLKPRESCRTVFIQQRILTFPCIFILKSVMFLKNNPKYFVNLGSFGEYEIRNTDKYLFPSHRTTLFQKSPLYNCIKLYNFLPKHLRALPKTRFKKEVKSFLIVNAFYSVSEYVSFCSAQRL